MKKDTFYCNICGAAFSGGGSSGANMWCPRCYNTHTDAQNRVYTRDTVYLICKWHAEGMTVKEIALLLSRSEDNVQQALLIGSKKPGIAAKYMQYFIPRAKKAKPRKGQLYNVYDRINKKYLITNATAEECAHAMGVSTQVFHIRKRTCEQHSDWSQWFIYRSEDIDAR